MNPNALLKINELSKQGSLLCAGLFTALGTPLCWRKRSPCCSRGSATPEMPAQAQLGLGAPESTVARGQGASACYGSGSVNNGNRLRVSAVTDGRA